MKKNILKVSLFICTIFLIFADQIEENKKRIQQIDNQVDQNNQKSIKIRLKSQNIRILKMRL